MTFAVALAFFLFYGGGIALAAIVLRTEHLREKGLLQAGALVWCVGTGAFLSRVLGDGPIFLAAVIPGGFVYGGCFAYFFAGLILRLRTWGLGDATLKVEPTFDQAEAAEKRQDWEGALRLYRIAAQKEPQHAETRRRLGEAYLRVEDLDQGIMELRAAMGLSEDPEKKVTVAFRVCDLLVERKSDAFNAELILRSLEKDHAGTRVAELARIRREKLRV
ncbi:MAG: hypothetical protein HYY18_02705 [Planctomycetes bacterium]|nr:hypothetical protein [Planctomycetota bacterium]